jgi:hypothetical protein
MARTKRDSLAVSDSGAIRSRKVRFLAFFARLRAFPRAGGPPSLSFCME